MWMEALLMGKCNLKHDDGSIPLGLCNRKDVVQFIPFVWNGEQGSYYLLHYVLTDNIFS